VEVRELSLEAADNARLGNFAGPMEQNLRHVEERLGVEVRRRGHRIQVLGPPGSVANAHAVLTRMFELSAVETMSPERVHLCVQELGFPASVPEQESNAEAAEVIVQTQRGGIRGRGPNQRQYLENIGTNDLTFGIGPAGTGKTYLAVATGVALLKQRVVDRLILSRPAVEAGERLGFLPGDMKDKVDPYLRPLYDALQDMLPDGKLGAKLESGQIEIAPLAFMRGRTLANAFVILDEGQNTTPAQMKMFLTRLGENSRMVVTGDPSQHDLPPGTRSGLNDAVRRLARTSEVAVIRFSEEDIVRHPLVEVILKAYAGETAAPSEIDADHD
jgi:phosphate starvation-inducible PhoH-like protein